MPSTSVNATTTCSINNNDFNTFGHTVAGGTGAITFILQGGNPLVQNFNNNTFTNMSVNTTGTITFFSFAPSIDLHCVDVAQRQFNCHWIYPDGCRIDHCMEFKRLIGGRIHSGEQQQQFFKYHPDRRFGLYRYSATLTAAHRLRALTETPLVTLPLAREQWCRCASTLAALARTLTTTRSAISPPVIPSPPC